MGSIVRSPDVSSRPSDDFRHGFLIVIFSLQLDSPALKAVVLASA